MGGGRSLDRIGGCLDIAAPLGSDSVMSRQNPVDAQPIPTEDTATRIVRERLGWREPVLRRDDGNQEPSDPAMREQLTKLLAQALDGAA